MGWELVPIDEPEQPKSGGGWVLEPIEQDAPEQPQIDVLGSAWQGIKNIPGAIKGAVTAPFGIVSDMGQGLGENIRYLRSGNPEDAQAAIEHLSAAADPMLRLGLGTAGYLTGGFLGAAGTNQIANQIEQLTGFAPKTNPVEDVNQAIADATTGGVMVGGIKTAGKVAPMAGRLIPESAKTQAINAYSNLRARANDIGVTPTVMDEAAINALAKDKVPAAVASKIEQAQALADAEAIDAASMLGIKDSLLANKADAANLTAKTNQGILKANEAIRNNRDLTAKLVGQAEAERAAAIRQLGPYGLDKVEAGGPLTKIIGEHEAAATKSMKGDGSPFKGLNEADTFPLKDAKAKVADVIDQEFPRIVRADDITKPTKLNTFEETADPKVVRLWQRFTQDSAKATTTIAEAQQLRHEVASLAREYGRNLSIMRNRGGDTAPLQANYRVLKAMEKGLVDSAVEGSQKGMVPAGDVAAWKSALAEYSDYIQTYKVGAVEKIASPFGKKSQAYQRMTRTPEDFSQALRAAGPDAEALRAMVRNVELSKLAANDFNAVKSWTLNRGAIVKQAFEPEHLANIQKIADSFDRVESLKNAGRMNKQRFQDRKENIRADATRQRSVFASNKIAFESQKANLLRGKTEAKQAGAAQDAAIKGAEPSAADVIAESISGKPSAGLARLIRLGVDGLGITGGGIPGAMTADIAIAQAIKWFEKRPDAAKAILVDMLQDPAKARQLTAPASSRSLAPFARALTAAAISQSDRLNQGPDGSLISTQTTRAKAPKSVNSPISQPSVFRSSSNPKSVFAPMASKTVPEGLKKAVEYVESRGNERAQSSAGAVGPMQVTPIAYRDVLRDQGIDDKQFSDAELRAELLANPELNRAVGEAYLAKLIKKYDGNIERALTAYHSGPGNVAKGRIGPQGRAYAPSVFRRWKA